MNERWICFCFYTLQYAKMGIGTLWSAAGYRELFALETYQYIHFRAGLELNFKICREIILH